LELEEYIYSAGEALPPEVIIILFGRNIKNKTATGKAS
jgi:hypothetical protein